MAHGTLRCQQLHRDHRQGKDRDERVKGDEGAVPATGAGTLKLPLHQESANFKAPPTGVESWIC